MPFLHTEIESPLPRRVTIMSCTRRVKIQNLIIQTHNKPSRENKVPTPPYWLPQKPGVLPFITYSYCFGMLLGCFPVVCFQKTDFEFEN